MTETEKLAICTILKMGSIPESQLKYDLGTFLELPEISPSDKYDIVNLWDELEALLTKEKERFEDLKETADALSDEHWQLKKAVENFMFKITDPKIKNMYEYKELLKTMDG